MHHSIVAHVAQRIRAQAGAMRNSKSARSLEQTFCATPIGEKFVVAVDAVAMNGDVDDRMAAADGRRPMIVPGRSIVAEQRLFVWRTGVVRTQRA